MKNNRKISPISTIFLTMSLMAFSFPTTSLAAAKAKDTEVEDVDNFEHAEVPQSDDAALGEMEKMVLTETVIDDADAESKKAKSDADASERQLAEAQSRLNEMKLYKASLAQITKSEVAQAEKRKLEAEKERQALDAQRKKIEAEVAQIQRDQKKIEDVDRQAKLKAERAKEQLQAAKERRNLKRKATTKAAPLRTKPNSLTPVKRVSTQQARI